MKIAIYEYVDKHVRRQPDISWEQGCAEVGARFGMKPEDAMQSLLAGFASTHGKDWIAIEDDGTPVGDVTTWWGREHEGVRPLPPRAA